MSETTIEDSVENVPSEEPGVAETAFSEGSFEPPIESRVLSQRDYAPTPYEASRWEIVGERVKVRHFVSMNLEVLRDERASSDPMFECFDAPENAISSSREFETPGTEFIPFDGAEASSGGMSDEELEALLQEKFEEGKAAGLEEGRAEAEEKITESYEALTARMGEITASIEKEVKKSVGVLERKALSFALEISRKILQTTAQIKPEYIFDVIKKGVENLGAAEAIKVRVSLDDYEFLDVIGLPSDLSEEELGVKYVADETIKSGCVIETNYGEISLELDTMWEQIKNSLFSEE